MPAGNDQLVSLVWQPLPGAEGAQIYPLIRKIDTISSNSYLIQTPDAIILIDPGGLTEQAEQLMQVVAECRAEKERPFVIILTHAHIDHFIAIQNTPALAFSKAVVIMVQEDGAIALEQGDHRQTQATMFNIELCPMGVGYHILSPERREHPGIPVDLCLANGSRITTTTHIRDPATPALDQESILFGPSGPAVGIYHTPGHSRDSICIRIGSLLFIGDLLFAASPGIAGLAGWSQEELVRSLDGVGSLLEKEDIALICPGHGRLIPAGDAKKTLQHVRKDALTLGNIAEFNPERAAQTAAYAEDCMEQVNQLFTIMAGRLYYVTYVLDELEESGTAAGLDTLINGDDIDELLDAFRIFSEEHHKKNAVSVHLALKAGQVIGKLQRTFNKDELAHIIDPSLVHRTERLLSDYITMFRGFTPPGEIVVVDLAALVESLVEGLSIPALTSEDVFSSADDEKAFTRILLESIGTRPLLEEVDFTLVNVPEPVPVTIDRDHFTDLLTYILEDLVGTGSPAVHISVTSKDAEAEVRVSGPVSPSCHDEGQTARGFLFGLCERAGGTLSFTLGDDGERRYTIRVNRVV